MRIFFLQIMHLFFFYMHCSLAAYDL